MWKLLIEAILTTGLVVPVAITELKRMITVKLNQSSKRARIDFVNI